MDRSDGRWRALVETSPFFVLVVDRAGRIRDINRTVAPWTREDVIGRDCAEFLPPTDIASAREQLERVFETRRAETSESRTTEGHCFTTRTVPVERDGSVDEVLFITVDDTVAKVAQETLERRERLFRALVEKGASGFALLDVNGLILYASPSSLKLMSGAGDVDVDAFAGVHPDDRRTALRMFARALSRRGTSRGRLRMVCRTGEIRTLAVVLTNMLSDPAVAGIVVNFDDVTEQRAAEEERDRFFDLSLDLMCVVGADGYFRRLNPAWEQTLGWTTEELLAKPSAELVHPDDRAASAELHRSVVASPGLVRAENRYRCRDGTYRWLQWKGCSDDTGVTYAIARDVTAKKRTDEQLLHSQKMEAIGRLAGGIAHDLNNMLAVVYAGTDSLLEILTEGDQAREDVDDIRHVAERSAALVGQLLTFSRKQSRTVRVLDLDETVSVAAKMIKRLIGENVRVDTRVCRAGRVRADPAHLEAVLMNLALNARDALPSGGTVSITTSKRTIGDTEASERAMSPGEYAVITVSDDGTGMSSEVRSRIFEPFFTTKPVGKGTGLGLPAVFGIVQQSGGSIFVDSEEGRGTEITIFLPSLPSEAVDSRTVERAVGRGAGRVLLVEDDALVRSGIARMLQRTGFTVTAVASGDEALSIARTDTLIDIVLSDVVMPGKDGVATTTEIRQLRPEVRIVLMSGYTEHPTLERATGGWGVLRKPFTAAQLTRALQRP